LATPTAAGTRANSEPSLPATLSMATYSTTPMSTSIKPLRMARGQ
jgi:hypothetical protein